MKSSKGDKALYEGFDRIYHVVPSFSWHQFVLFCLVSSCTILSGMVSFQDQEVMNFRSFQVQTGSVFLNAKPEKLRCKNEFDLYRNNSFDAGAFASTKSGCGVQNQNWNQLCPEAYNLVEYNQCYDELGLFLFLKSTFRLFIVV